MDLALAHALSQTRELDAPRIARSGVGSSSRSVASLSVENRARQLDDESIGIREREPTSHEEIRLVLVLETQEDLAVVRALVEVHSAERQRVLRHQFDEPRFEIDFGVQAAVERGALEGRPFEQLPDQLRIFERSGVESAKRSLHDGGRSTEQEGLPEPWNRSSALATCA